MKLFGVGAAVVPVIGGIPDIESRALIVVPPTIEVPERPKIIEASTMQEATRTIMTISFPDGTSFKATVSNVEWTHSARMVDVTNLGSPWRQHIPTLINPGRISMDIVGEGTFL